MGLGMIFNLVGKATKGFVLTAPFHLWFWLGLALQAFVPNPFGWVVSDTTWVALEMLAAPTFLIVLLHVWHFLVTKHSIDGFAGLTMIIQWAIFGVSVAGGCAFGPLVIPPMTAGLILPMALCLLCLTIPVFVRAFFGPGVFMGRLQEEINLLIYNLPYKLSRRTTHGSARCAHFLQSAWYYAQGDFIFGVAVRPYPPVQSAETSSLNLILRPIVLRVTYWLAAARILLFGVPKPKGK